jgi:succinate dehydrogenase / fumarate reductase membrane anchor subunit
MKGSLIWNLQRYSSLLILLYLLYVIGFIVNSEDQINFFTWSDFFLSFQSRIFTSLVCFLIVLHSFIGLWTVGTDYLTERTLGFLSKSLSKIAVLIQQTYLFTFIVLGIVYLIVILYIIWI